MTGRYTLDQWRQAEEIVQETQEQIRREAIEENREMFEYMGQQKRLAMLLTWKPGDFDQWPIEDLASILYSGLGRPSEQEPDMIASVRFPFGEKQRQEFIEVWKRRKGELDIAPAFPEPPRREVEIILPDYSKKYSGLRLQRRVMTLGERLKFGSPLNENKRKQAYQQLQDLEKKAENVEDQRQLANLEKEMQKLREVVDDPVVVEARQVVQHCDDQIEYYTQVREMYQAVHDQKMEILKAPFERLKYKIKGIYQRIGKRPPEGYNLNRAAAFWHPQTEQDFDRLHELGLDFDVFENDELLGKYKRSQEEERARVKRYYGEFYEPL